MGIIDSFLDSFKHSTMDYEPVVTPNAKAKMLQHGISKWELMAAFKSSVLEKSIKPGTVTGVAQINGYKVCAMYASDPRGQWVIVSCWKVATY